jgi:predicted nuclease of predicted toxin-antitoxin system
VKVKLDENLGTAGAEFLPAAGFDVATVAQQQLTSAPDRSLASICAAEGRCLVTLDKDFSDPIRYPPRNYAGIVVVRLQGRFQVSLLEQALGLVVEAAKERDVRRRLWIAEVNRVREYDERTE